MSPLSLFARRWILTTLLIILAAGVFIRLGVWQLARLQQRRAFNAHYADIQTLPPLNLPAADDLPSMEYRQVRAVGRYDFGNQVALRNQYNGVEYGYHLLTPLLLSDGEAVLVDRGWIPAGDNSLRESWGRYDEPGEVRVSGIIRLGGADSPFALAEPTLGPDRTRRDLWNTVDLGGLSAQIPYGLLPVYIQLDPDDARSQPPIPYQPVPELTEGPHLSYALQWFSFALISVAGYLGYVRRQESKSTP
jgi:surfeit locus 1 family protein